MFLLLLNLLDGRGGMAHAMHSHWRMHTKNHPSADGANRPSSGRHVAAALKPTAIIVAHAGARVRVPLKILARRRIHDTWAVCLADAWVASGLGGDLTALRFVLVDREGARAESLSDVQIEGTRLPHALLDLSSGDVFWDHEEEAASVPRIKAVVELVASAA